MNILRDEMEFRLLKLATRKLLNSFGSLQAAAEVCRVKPTNLSQYQSFEHTAFMPIDVVIHLQRAASSTVLSEEMAKLGETNTISESERGVRDEALDIPVAVGQLLAFVCEATAVESAGGPALSENEKRRYFELRNNVEAELRELDAAVQQDGSLVRAKKA
ncbi:MAG: hypothetical protein HQ483_03100 [Rhodospirillales bacterium]|nr:hypothetical protein [Rhodospirillales bacterium]